MMVLLQRTIQTLVMVTGIICLVATGASAAKKVALVIGTDAYQNLPVLQKAVNDARAITDTLTSIGFEVIKGENLTRRQMNRSLANLERTISPGDQVFFFFAGHGVALGATNYLIPADMPLPDAGEESLVRGEAFAVDLIVERIQARGASASFVVLDACRNNPFKTRGVRSIGSTRGLRDISTPKGVFVLFSAGIGQTALDRLHDGDKNPNSVFTRNLVPLLKQPGLSHVQLAKRVQSDVDKLARTIRHEQQPAYYDQVIGNMYLIKGEPAARSNLEAVKITPSNDVLISQIIKTKIERSEKNLSNSDQQVFWTSVRDSNDVVSLRLYLTRYPKGVFAELAKLKIASLKKAKIPKLVKKSNNQIASLKPKTDVVQKAFLYEEGKDGSSASRDNATIIWSLEHSLLGNGIREAVIKGKLDVPERNLSMTLLIKPNRDDVLPASHIIELQFQLPKSFSGGTVSDVSRFVMKTSEQARGEGLIAVPAKISDGNFLIALNNLEQAIVKNNRLMLESSWIDLPLGYKTGRRALITLEKGTQGNKVFRKAFAEWN